MTAANPVPLRTVLLLAGARVCMTFAWCGRLRTLQEAIASIVFAGSAIVIARRPLKLDMLRAVPRIAGAAHVVGRPA